MKKDETVVQKEEEDNIRKKIENKYDLECARSDKYKKTENDADLSVKVPLIGPQEVIEAIDKNILTQYPHPLLDRDIVPKIRSKYIICNNIIRNDIKSTYEFHS